MNLTQKVIKAWLPLAAAITLISGVFYVAIQQTLRLGANEPQVQMAKDAAQALANGESAESLLTEHTIDVASSLAPYLAVYDANGKALASNARLHGNPPELPAGVFDYTRQRGEDRISWQPEPGVRSAVVIVPVSGGQGGYVLAGRSLRETEARIELLNLQVGFGLVATLIGTLVVVGIVEWLPWLR